MTLHLGVTTVVRTPEGHTDEFPISEGVMQGNTLAPHLSTVMVDEIMSNVASRTGQHGTTFYDSNGSEL